MPTAHKLHALVLQATDHGESDRVVALLTAERGKLAAFAHGARASRRRFGGALEPFNLLAAELRERPGGGLWTLESAAVARGFGAIRGDLARIACAAYACDLARSLVREQEAHPDLYALLLALLERLDAAPAEPAALRAFELGALRATGLLPRLDACARCGGALPGAPARLAFSPEDGGFLCAGCAPGAPRAPRCGPDAAVALRRLAEGGLAAAGPLPGPVAAEARDLLTRFLEHHLGRRLPSRRFLDEVGPMLG